MVTTSIEKSHRQGLFWGFVSYFLWGFFPVYWKMLADRWSIEVLAHRMIWSFVFYFLIYTGLNWKKIRPLFSQSKRDWILSFLAALLLALNWGLYIYAVNSDQILEGSLAYFINPILNVAVGVLFFREKFPFALKLSVLFAVLGVCVKMTSADGFPWIALVLAFTFCAYGITKKTLQIPARSSSALEGLVSLPFAAGILAWLSVFHPQPIDLKTWTLFICGGVVTGLPLFLFSYAAQRIPYSVMGMLQFIAPSLQFIVAIWLFSEPVGATSLAAFGLIWVGILFYLGNLFRA